MCRYGNSCRRAHCNYSHGEGFVPHSQQHHGRRGHRFHGPAFGAAAAAAAEWSATAAP